MRAMSKNILTNLFIGKLTLARVHISGHNKKLWSEAKSA